MQKSPQQCLQNLVCWLAGWWTEIVHVVLVWCLHPSDHVCLFPLYLPSVTINALRWTGLWICTDCTLADITLS